ncbi:MAG: helix-turn-helix transcriptional regulator [Halobacteriaceae archaeon]
MRSQVVLVAILAVALLALPVAPAGAQTAGGASSGDVTITVRVASDGDAHWTVSTAYPLRTENESAAFDRLAAEYESGESVGFSSTTFERLAATASERTGRDMAIRNVSRQAVRRNGTDGTTTGVITLEFTWTSFARRDDGVVVGDAFGDDWGLAEDQTLRLEPPTGYAVSSVQPSTAIDDGTVRWTGPLAFDGGEPRVVYVPRARSTTTTTTTPPTSGTSTGTTPGPTGDGVLVPAGVVAVLVVGGAVAVLLARRTDGAASDEFDDGDGSAGAAAATADTTADAEADAPVEDGAAGDVVDPELLSDEERVERLLRANGGRMKQANIVDETDWSNAKVSQLLSAMTEEGRVEKLRIGRENLITLAESDDEAKG